MKRRVDKTIIPEITEKEEWPLGGGGCSTLFGVSTSTEMLRSRSFELPDCQERFSGSESKNGLRDLGQRTVVVLVSERPHASQNIHVVIYLCVSTTDLFTNNTPHLSRLLTSYFYYRESVLLSVLNSRQQSQQSFHRSLLLLIYTSYICFVLLP